jgi:hypothetical protein
MYIKTAKGMNELLTRNSSIDSRLNAMLILIDGQRTTADIKSSAATAGLPADAIDLLLHGGYIVQKPGLSRESFGAPKINAAPATGPPVLVDGSDDAASYKAFYEFLVKTSKDLLGLRGFPFQLRIEQAQNLAALTGMVSPLSEAIAKRHGLEVAQKFVANSKLIGKGIPVSPQQV